MNRSPSKRAKLGALYNPNNHDPRKAGMEGLNNPAGIATNYGINPNL